jgi:hypothetical protein
MRARNFIASLIVSISFVSVMSAMTKRPRTIPNGTWGGQHIQIVVTNGAATIEYDCATGKIAAPLKLDSHGRFVLKGTHAAEHGGPTREEESGGGEPAQFSGWTDGHKMKLTVTLTNSKTDIGTFELTRGSEGRIFKCR